MPSAWWPRSRTGRRSVSKVSGSGKPFGWIVAAFVATIAPAFEVDAAEGRRVVIEIRSFKFVPPAPVIRRGDVIVWINKDIVPHSATANDDSWDTGQIEAGKQVEMVALGTMFGRYYCKFHPAMTARLAEIGASPAAMPTRDDPSARPQAAAAF